MRPGGESPPQVLGPCVTCLPVPTPPPPVSGTTRLSARLSCLPATALHPAATLRRDRNWQPAHSGVGSCRAPGQSQQARRPSQPRRAAQVPLTQNAAPAAVPRRPSLSDAPVCAGPTPTEERWGSDWPLPVTCHNRAGDPWWGPQDSSHWKNTWPLTAIHVEPQPPPQVAPGTSPWTRSLSATGHRPHLGGPQRAPLRLQCCHVPPPAGPAGTSLEPPQLPVAPGRHPPRGRAHSPTVAHPQPGSGTEGDVRNRLPEDAAGRNHGPTSRPRPPVWRQACPGRAGGGVLPLGGARGSAGRPCRTPGSQASTQPRGRSEADILGETSPDLWCEALCRGQGGWRVTPTCVGSNARAPRALSPAPQRVKARARPGSYLTPLAEGGLGSSRRAVTG